MITVEKVIESILLQRDEKYLVNKKTFKILQQFDNQGYIKSDGLWSFIKLKNFVKVKPKIKNIYLI